MFRVGHIYQHDCSLTNHDIEIVKIVRNSDKEVCMIYRYVNRMTNRVMYNSNEDFTCMDKKKQKEWTEKKECQQSME